RRACCASTRSLAIARGLAIASLIARGVISVNTTRCRVLSLSRPRSLRISAMCQLIASPSRSGSVARNSASADLAALAIASTCFWFFSIRSYRMAKPLAGSTAPSFGTRSRTWPYEARTVKSLPRYLLIVLALAGDSTMRRFFAMDTVPEVLAWRGDRAGTWHHVQDQDVGPKTARPRASPPVLFFIRWTPAPALSSWTHGKPSQDSV